jgi:hypothetical protein
MKKDLSYKNRIFCIRENNQWVAGVYHRGITFCSANDKKQEIALIKLCYNLVELYDKNTN